MGGKDISLNAYLENRNDSRKRKFQNFGKLKFTKIRAEDFALKIGSAKFLKTQKLGSKI